VTVEEKMFSIFQGLAAVTAIVPIERIKGPGDWQNLARPYIVHFPVAVEPIHTHTEGLMGLKIWRFYQVSIIAASYGLAATIRDVLIDALDGYHDSDVNRIAYLGVGMTNFDTDKKIAEMALNFEVSEGLAA